MSLTAISVPSLLQMPDEPDRWDAKQQSHRHVESDQRDHSQEQALNDGRYRPTQQGEYPVDRGSDQNQDHYDDGDVDQPQQYTRQ